MVSTHSRLKAAGEFKYDLICRFAVSTHSRLKAAGHTTGSNSLSTFTFQHTAA